MIVTDERGDRWEVARGDPADWAVQPLKAKGFREIVLPTTLLIHGQRIEGLPWPSEQEAVRLTNDARAGRIAPDQALTYLACLDACRELFSVLE